MAVQTQLLQDDAKEISTVIVIEVFGCMLALLANIGFQGLFLVGAFLEQPYGDRSCHARVSQFCRLSIKQARTTLSAGNPRKDEAPKEIAEKQRKEVVNKLSSMGVTSQSKREG